MKINKKMIIRCLVTVTLLLVSGVVTMAQNPPDDPTADTYARSQMAPTLNGGTGLFNSYSPRTLHWGEISFGVFYNNVKRDPGALDINTIPANITVGLGHNFEAYVNADFFQQVTSRQPFLLSGPGFGFPLRLGIDPFQFFGPPTRFGKSPFFPGTFNPFGSILPALSAPNTPGTRIILIDKASYFNDFPFAPGVASLDPTNPANDVIRQSANGMGNVHGGLKWAFINPDTHWFGAALIGDISFPTAKNFNALAKGRGTGATDFGLTLALSQEFKGHRLRFVENVGYVNKDAPSRNDINLINLANEMNMSGGVSYYITKHIESVSEVVGTVFIGGRTPNYNQVNPLDYQTGARFYFLDGRLSFGGAFRVNMTRTDPHDNIPGLIFSSAAGGFIPVTFNIASPGVSSYVAYASFGLRRPSAPPAPPAVNQPPVVNCSVTPTSLTLGQGSATVTASAVVRDPENDLVTYTWTVSSGGNFTGSTTGPTVSLDATNMAAGSYTVTVSVDDKHNPPVTCSSTFTVVAPPPPPPPPAKPCPTISSLTVDPSSVTEGDNTKVTATVNASIADGSPLSYQWSVSQGSVTGSGSSVTIDTTGMPAGTVTVRVTATDGTCPVSQSTSFTIAAKPAAPQASQIGICGFPHRNESRTNNPCKAFLDSAASQSQQNQRATILIQSFSDANERPATTRLRAEKARDYLVSKGIDASRIKIVTVSSTRLAPNATEGNNRNIVIWIVPEGAQEPQ